MRSVVSTRTDIQALRGIAVLLVVLYHAEFGIVRAGYLGVDIFFVISGYLITGLICRRIDDQRFLFGGFYWQRAKRLLPAAYATFLVTTLLSCQLVTRLELQAYLHQLIGAATFTANFVLAQQDSYFDSAAALKPLLHVWSLSVEEQYYLLAPALLWLVSKRGRRPMVLGFLIASLLLCFLFARSKPSFAFYLLPARAWELSIGSLIAIWPVPHEQSRVRTIGGIVAALMVVLIPLFPLDSVHPRTDALLVCLVTAFAIIARPTVLNSGLLARGLARIGDISYSLYLVHWPLFVMVRHLYFAQPPLEIRAACLAGSFALAVVLYRYVENPIHRSDMQPSRPALALALLIPFALVAGTSVFLTVSARGIDWAELRKPVTGFAAACDYKRPGFAIRRECQNADNPSIAIWGDSFAMHLVAGLAAQDHGQGIVQITRSTCPAVLDHLTVGASCASFNRAALAFLRRDDRIKTVVLSSAYDPTPLLPTIRELRTAGKKVIFVAHPPSNGTDFSICVERLLSQRLNIGAPANCAFAADEYRRYYQSAIAPTQQLAAAGDIAVIWPSDYFCNAQSCATHDGHTPFFRDAGHFSVFGSIEFARRAGLLDDVVRLAR